MTRVTSEILLTFGTSGTLSLVAKVALVCAAALLVARVCRRSRAALRHLIFAATFGVLVLLPVATAFIPPVLVRVPVASARAVPAITDIAAPVTSVVNATDPGTSKRAAAAATLPALPNLWRTAWIVGFAIFLAPVVAGLWQLRGIRRRSIPWLEGQALVDRPAMDAGVRRRIAVLRHERISGPLTCGVFTPVILLPSDVEDWKDEALRSALTHEIEHVRRNDWFTQCSARVACAVLADT